MQVFAVFHLSNPTVVAEAIRTRFPNDHYALGNNEWLVASNGVTSKEIGDVLGISDGRNGYGIVVAMNSYWGWATNNIWEWVSLKKAQPNG
jgi:hypothetical protein